MPSCITHQIISEEAVKLFPPEISACVTAHPDYYFLGAQGPDVFFFYRPMHRKQMNTGRFMHRHRVYDVFTTLTTAPDTFTSFHRSRLTAYAVGFLCHYCADVAFHPFVYAYLDAHPGDKSRHQLMETDWDTYFARTKRGKSPEGWKFPFRAKKINAEGSLLLLYNRLAEAIGWEKFPKRKFEHGISLYERYLKFFHKKSRHRAWARTERILHLSPVVSSQYPRKNPNPDWLSGKELETLAGASSVDVLFDRALAEIARLIPLLFLSPLPREDFGKSFLTARPSE